MTRLDKTCQDMTRHDIKRAVVVELAVHKTITVMENGVHCHHIPMKMGFNLHCDNYSHLCGSSFQLRCGNDIFMNCEWDIFNFS